jgi:hypothetical protein
MRRTLQAYLSAATITFSLSLSTVLGCATSMFNPADLKQPAVKSIVTLPRWYTFTAQSGATRFFLAPGKYEAEFENDGGTFLRGPANCIVQGDTGGKYSRLLMEGGIFVPKEKTLPVKFYYYKGLEKSGPPLDAATAAGSVPSADADGGAAVTPNVAGVAPVVAPNATPVGQGVGGGVGNAIVGGIIALDRGKLQISYWTPPTTLRSALVW